jgi:hypothetical protein
MEREALRECVSACSISPAVFLSKFRGALQTSPIADFHGRENNQSSQAGNPWFLGDSVIFGPLTLIIFSAQSDSVGFVSAFSVV